MVSDVGAKTAEYDFTGMYSDVNFPGHPVARFKVLGGVPTTT
jgi:hypothetical protein